VRKGWRAGWMILAAALFLHMVPAVKAEEARPAPKSVYTGEIRIDPLQHQINGNVEIRFWPIREDRVYLHVYPAAFASSQEGGLWRELLGDNAENGSYRINSLLVSGKAAEFTQTETLVEVSLANAAKGQAVCLELEFSLTLPRNEGRLSYDEHALWLGNWLPILAVHDEEGWHLDPYVPIGDPFYSETSDYSLDVTIPEGYQLASTAADHEARADRSVHGSVTYHLKAENVRDFALVVMDKTYRKLETRTGDTLVRTWWRAGDDAEQARLQHEAAWKSLAYFGGQFGSYPYAEYDVVRTGGSINGMEYPALIFIDGRNFQPVGTSTPFTVVHETAHQWFYGIVGNNQWEEAWLDEGLAEYASYAFLRGYDPELAFQLGLYRLVHGTLEHEYAERQLAVWQDLDAFPDNQSYSALVYSRSFVMLSLLKDAWGEERLHAVLRRHIQENWLDVARGEKFVELLSEEAGEDAAPYIAYWLYLDMEKQAEAEAWLDRQRKAAAE